MLSFSLGIGDTDIDALCAGLKRAGGNLTTLDISCNQIADAGLEKLVTAFAFTNLLKMVLEVSNVFNNI